MSFLKSIFSKETADLTFYDVTTDRAIYPHYPPMLAKDVKPFFKKEQEEKFESFQFPGCPGMHDYSRLGYIIPAWSNFHIKANKAGSVAVVGALGQEGQKRGTNLRQPKQMSTTVTDGLFKFEDDVMPAIWNFPGAWSVRSNKNVSALIMPAIFHSKFLDDLYVYPGVVDYNGFTTMNFICSAKRSTEVYIQAGDPILHVIPFVVGKDFVATYGSGSEENADYNRCIKWFHTTNFYRKYYMIRKKFRLEKL